MSMRMPLTLHGEPAAVYRSQPYPHAVCTLCTTPLQRTLTGTLVDGVIEHWKQIHHLAVRLP